MTGTVNFEHLKGYQSIYEGCCLAEKNIVEDTKVEILSAMRELGNAFEKMVSALTKHRGITDQHVLMIKQMRGKNEGGANLFGKVLALGELQVISSDSKENYEAIRKLRNQAVHEDGGPYKDAPLTQIKADAEKMYSLFYRESYLFANEYMKEPAGPKAAPAGQVRAGSPAVRNAAPRYTAAPAQKSGSPLKTLLCIIIFVAVFVYVITFIERWTTMQNDYNQMEQYVQQQMEENLQKMEQMEQNREELKRRVMQQLQQ